MLTDKQKVKKIEKRLQKLDMALGDPSLTREVERELFLQYDILRALHSRLRLDMFMAKLGYAYVRVSGD